MAQAEPAPIITAEQIDLLAVTAGKQGERFRLAFTQLTTALSDEGSKLSTVGRGQLLEMARNNLVLLSHIDPNFGRNPSGNVVYASNDPAANEALNAILADPVLQQELASTAKAELKMTDVQLPEVPSITPFASLANSAARELTGSFGH